MPNSGQLLSAAQAARLAGISVRTIQLAITRGELRADKMPGRTGAYLIHKIDLAAYLSTREDRDSA